jgi:hypothetical protein
MGGTAVAMTTMKLERGFHGMTGLGMCDGPCDHKLGA